MAMVYTRQGSDAQEQLAVDLWEAVRYDDVINVRSLLGQGANPNHQLYWSNDWYRIKGRLPPIHEACKKGYMEITSALVGGGANVEMHEKRRGRTAFHCACVGGNKKIVVYLSQTVKCRIDVRDWKNRTPLHWACEGGSKHVVQYLVQELKLDVYVTNNYAATPLHWACWNGHKDIVQWLVKVGKCDVDVRDKHNQTPLHWACWNGQKDTVQWLVEVGKCNVDVTSVHGKTNFDRAVQQNHTEVVDYLKSLAESSCPEPCAPLTEDDCDALKQLLTDNKIEVPPALNQLSFEQLQQLIRDTGHDHRVLAANLRTELDEVIQRQRRYFDKLMNLLVDTEAVNICTLKLCLVGPPHVGKTTTLNRLLQVYENIQSAGDKAKHPSTLLANCVQAMALINKETAQWISSKDVDEEAKMMFGYLCGNLTIDDVNQPITTAEDGRSEEKESSISQPKGNVPHIVNTQIVQQSTPADPDDKAAVVHQNKLSQVIFRLGKLIKSGNYSKMASCFSTLLNINDVGGQPAFLEMLPALSNGPVMYLVFLDLSKELDVLYDIPFSRDDTVITPYKSIHTVKAAVSQILSSIASVRHMSELSKPFITNAELKEKFENFLDVAPVATLIGTHKDKLGEDSTGLEKEKLTRDKVVEINEALKPITQTFDKILVFPKQQNEPDHTSEKDANSSSDRMSFFALDNNGGTESSEISPLRDLMNEIFCARFSKASLPISKNWLVLGIILRKEYKIATIDDCIKIGTELEMDEDDIKFCLWYLHSIGSIMFYTKVPNDDDPRWLLKCHVICLPQVIFDSISQLIIVSMRAVHGGGMDTECERAELIKKGQFSLEAIERHCKLNVQVTKNLENKLLIPSQPLVKLLKYLNLLSEITHKDEHGERITYLMPAILDCATQDELTNPPQPDANNPEPLHITFSFGYVPTGVFCGLITRLVSQGPHGILGLTWELVEDGVKRNYVSFYVDYVHKVTLLSHVRSYEIRVERNAEQTDFSLHDLCSYTLSAILYSLKTLFPKLILSVAFQCSCHKHAASKSLDNLCTLVQGRKIHFLCGRSPVTLSKGQQVWLGKDVSLESSTELEVIKFVEDGFSFHWSKEGSRRQIKTTDVRPNTLSFRSVSVEDFGHYQCEVKDQACGKVVLTVYRALYKEETSNGATELATDGVPHTTTVHQHEIVATAAQLSRECSGEALLQLSTEIAGYNIYKHRLGLSDADIHEIDNDARNFYTAQGKFYAALKKWKSKSIDVDNPSTSSATYGRLVEIAAKIEDGEAVRSIHKACVKHIGN